MLALRQIASGGSRKPKSPDIEVLVFNLVMRWINMATHDSHAGWETKRGPGQQYLILAATDRYVLSIYSFYYRFFP